MTTKELLIAARALIADPEHFTQRWFAARADGSTESKEGYSLEINDPEATRFCSLGALYHVAGETSEEAYEAARALKKAAWPIIRHHGDEATVRSNGKDPSVYVTDKYGHAAALAMYDAAIAALPA